MAKAKEEKEAKYKTEKEGQLSFYETFLPRIDPDLKIDDLIANNNDGVIRGNLLEFKLNIRDLNEHLFQCIKYLSALRIKGMPVPANIIIVGLNSATAYYYKSENYLADIEKVYTGAASRNNTGFAGGECEQKFEYGNESKPIDTENLVAKLKENNYTKINIDENCIVGWAANYYKEKPTARKEDFLGDEQGKHKKKGEIRNPTIFQKYINPYKGETNVKFNYLMDKLNDTILKKNLGAFYTPPIYAEKAAILVRKAIARVPAGNDYIILDRCAGTGNLESVLSDEELSHCIVSTVEYYEYKVLQELIGSKVRHIIPPTENDDTFNAGLVNGADALTSEYLNNPIIKQYIDNRECSVILFENPPFAETTSIEHQKVKAGKKSSTWKHSFVVSEMKKEVKGTASNDLGNAFIWSAFKYYLRQSTDSYVVFSPVKYWKAQHLINKQYGGGYAFNRRHFHTNIDACIMCALWFNEDVNLSEFSLDGYDIDEKKQEVKEVVKLPVKRIYSDYSKVYFDKRKPQYRQEGGIVVGLDGLESKLKTRVPPIDDPDVLCYLDVHSSGFDNPDLNCSMVITSSYRGNGFFVRKDNFTEKLPMFAAGRYITYNREWTERARIMKSADGSEQFFKDVKSGKLKQFLLKCLLFTCIEMQNHCRSFTGSDQHFYKNELCLDSSNGETIALKELKKLTRNDTENQIFSIWEKLMEHVKKTEEYNSKLTYGIYQIYSEIDTSFKDENDNVVYNNPEVHTDLDSMKNLCKSYYNTEIVPTLFKYGFLK